MKLPIPRLFLVVVTVASLASCRGGRGRKAPESGGPLSLLPAEAGMVTVIDVAKLRAAPILANFGRGKSPTMPGLAMADLHGAVDGFAKKTGFHPVRDVDTVIIATAKKGQTGGGVIVRGRNLNEDRLIAQVVASAKEGSPVATMSGARKLWSASGVADIAAIFLNEGTLLIGSRGWVERMADLADGKGTQGSAASNLELARLLGGVSGHAIAGASLEPEEIPKLLQDRRADARPVPIRHATWTVDAGQRLLVAANAELASAADATAIAEQWRKKLTEPKLASLFRVRTDGATFRLEADLDEERLQTVALLATMLAAVPFVHMD